MNRAAVLGLLALSAWHVGLRLYGWKLPLLFDEGDYAYSARVWSEGGLPYRDAFDQKPPMIHFLYRAPVPPRLLATAASLGTMVLLYLSVPAGWSAAARLTAAAAYGVLSTTPVGDLGWPANTEVFLNLFMALAAFAWTRKKTALCGLACGAALMTKQTALWAVLVFAGLSFSPAYWLGAAAVPAAFAVYFAARGGLPWLLQDAFGRNLGYASIVSSPGDLAKQMRWFFGGLGPDLAKGDWPFWATALLGLGKSPIERKPNFELMVTLWLAGSALGVVTGWFLFPHYFLQAYAALALACAVGVERLGKPWLLLALTLYAPLVRAKAYFLDPPEVTARKLLYPNPLYEAREIGAYLKRATRPEDKIYVFGSESQIYVYADRRCATRHSYIYPLTLFPRGFDEGGEELKALEASPPKAVVYSAQPFSTLVGSQAGWAFREAFKDFLKRRYRWTGTVIVKADGADYDLGRPRGGSPDFDDPRALFVFER